MVGFAAAASLMIKEKGALEPEHISAPVHQSSGEEEMGQWGGRRDAEVLCYLTSFRRGNRAARREGIGEVPGERRKPAQQTHSLHTQHSFPTTPGRQSPLSSAAMGPMTPQRQRKSYVTCPDSPKPALVAGSSCNPITCLHPGKESRVST